MTVQRYTWDETGGVACDSTGEFVAYEDYAELVAALRGMVMACGKCWGNGSHYDKHDDKVDCASCKHARAVLAKLGEPV